MHSSTWARTPVFEVVVDRAQVQIVGLDEPEVAFDMGQVLVGGDHTGRIQGFGGHAGADHVDAVQEGLRLDLGRLPLDIQGGVGDRQIEVFGHLELVDHFADAQADLIGADQTPFAHRGGDRRQHGFGGGQQGVAFAGSFDGEQRIAARDKSFAG